MKIWATREPRAIYSGKFKLRERESLPFINRRKISFSLSELIRNETRYDDAKKKKKSQFIRGKMARSRYSRILLFRALRVFIVIPINKIAVYIFHSRWMIKKKKRIFARSRIIRLNRDGKIGNFSVIIAFIEKDDDLLPLCVPMCRLKFISYPMRYFDRFFEIRNNHPGIDDIFAARMNGRSMANQGIRPIQNGPRMSRIFRGEANIGHF